MLPNQEDVCLRRIALTVLDPERGEFDLCRLQSDGDSAHFPIEVALTEEQQATYSEVLMLGMEALADLTHGSLDNGPRRGK